MQDTRYWTIVFPGEYGQHVQETWTEDQIIKAYYTYWSSKMLMNNLGDDISHERCIEDWTVVHWAAQTDQWGYKINNQYSDLMSDGGMDPRNRSE